jgi:hypothetical protein
MNRKKCMYFDNDPYMQVFVEIEGKEGRKTTGT